MPGIIDGFDEPPDESLISGCRPLTSRRTWSAFFSKDVRYDSENESDTDSLYDESEYNVDRNPVYSKRSSNIMNAPYRHTMRLIFNDINREVKMTKRTNKTKSPKLPKELRKEIKVAGQESADRHDHPTMSEDLQGSIKAFGMHSSIQHLEKEYKSVRAQFNDMKDRIDGLTDAYTQRKAADFSETSYMNPTTFFKTNKANPARVAAIEEVQKVASKHELGKVLKEGSTPEQLRTEIGRLTGAVSEMHKAATALLNDVKAEYSVRSATNSSLYNVLHDAFTNTPKMSDIEETEKGVSYTLTF